MSLRSFLSGLVFMFPIYMFANIAGTYDVSGFDPATNKKYTGIVVIEKVGQVYIANWVFSDGSNDIGTGVLNDDSLAFDFHEISAGDNGVQLYEIDGHTLSGPWARFGTTQTGFEKLKKLKSSH